MYVRNGDTAVLHYPIDILFYEVGFQLPAPVQCSEIIQNTNYIFMFSQNNSTCKLKGQSEIAYLPKFGKKMLIIMVIVMIEILKIIFMFDYFENQ